MDDIRAEEDREILTAVHEARELSASGRDTDIRIVFQAGLLELCSVNTKRNLVRIKEMQRSAAARRGQKHTR